MALSLLARAFEEVSKCNRCGFCQTACPVYQVTRREASTARGHSYQLRSVIEGRLEHLPGISQPFLECLLCRASLPHCSPRVQTDKVVVAGRQALASRKRWPGILPGVSRKLFLEPRHLARYARLLAMAKRAGIIRMAALPGGPLARPADLLPDLPGEPLYARVRGMKLKPVAPKGKAVYFVGCGAGYLLPELGEATIRALTGSGFAVEVARNYCCGLPSYSYGDVATARRLAKGNLRLLALKRVDAIVTECASCSSFLKSYPDLLAEDLPFAEEAALMAGKIFDITELLAGVPPAGTSLQKPITVTYHDPCHASRYQGLREEPRAILNGIPGVTLVEMEESDWCCGGAGTYTLTNPDLAQRILDRKMGNVARTGAEALVTSCPACMVHLSYGARRMGLRVKVLHLTQVVSLAAAGAGVVKSGKLE